MIRLPITARNIINQRGLEVFQETDNKLPSLLTSDSIPEKITRSFVYQPKAEQVWSLQYQYMDKSYKTKTHFLYIEGTSVSTTKIIKIWDHKIVSHI